jgi:hypothetical protein
LSLVDGGKIDLKSPLRYYGRLADEPEKLPWGAGYEIELSGVDYEGAFIPASGGLRLGYVAQTDHPAPVALHVGDSVAVLTRAKLPQVLNSAAIAALLLLVAKPSALGDSGFQLSFLAIGCIGGLALRGWKRRCSRMRGHYPDGETRLKMFRASRGQRNFASIFGYWHAL